jgi:hypothetical protein
LKARHRQLPKPIPRLELAQRPRATKPASRPHSRNTFTGVCPLAHAGFFCPVPKGLAPDFVLERPC